MGKDPEIRLVAKEKDEEREGKVLRVFSSGRNRISHGFPIDKNRKRPLTIRKSMSYQE
jgi:hypothetical protein